MEHKALTALKNDRLIRALLRQNVDRTPIWIMRQAGRYLPEYRATRARAGSFLDLVQNPQLACEVTLQPLARFDLDAAILFSDILTIPFAMGLDLQFAAGEGPVFANPIRDEHAIQQLPNLDPERESRYVMDAVRLIKKDLNNTKPLIGFAGSPWTVACYMVEGSGSKEFTHIRALRYKRPELLAQLLDKLVSATVAYLNAQIAAGVDVVMLFDTWGGLLKPQDYLEFSLKPMQKILSQLTLNHGGRKIPTILFTKNSGNYLSMMADSGANALGIDWMTSLKDAKAQVGDRVALQGNLDPATLYGSPQTIEQAAKDILQVFGNEPGHVFNLGHGIYPDIDPEHVQVLIDTVHNYR